MISLIGPPGSGKTTVGIALAQRLGLPFVDHDALVTERHGDLGELVLTAGPGRLTAVQMEALDSLAGADVVLAVGSAALDHPRATAALAGGVVVYLAADLAHTFPRAGLHRPQPALLGARQLWARLLAERDTTYRAAAHHVVDVGDHTIAEVTEIICGLLAGGEGRELG